MTGNGQKWLTNCWKWQITENGLKWLETDENNDGDAGESNGMALSQFGLCLGYI